MRHIILLCLTVFSLFFQQMNAQELNVKGKVTDGHEPLIGVSVRVDGTTIGMITDLNGEYSLKVPNKNSKLVFSYVGYNTLTELVKGRRIINITMNENVQSLDEVVVVGYGTSTVKDLTSSVSSV